MPRQYDVHRLIGLRRESPADLAIILQDNHLEHLSTRIIAPVIPSEGRLREDRLMPIVQISSVEHLIAIGLLTTVSVRNIGVMVASFPEAERDVKRAIDLLFFGI